MSNTTKMGRHFKSFEYKEITVRKEAASFYLDCYENFGWIPDENLPSKNGRKQTTLRLKRDRRLVNKMELTRLQRNFEACAAEIAALDRAKVSAATVWSLTSGLVGTAFMAGSTFAVTAHPPIVWLCVLLAIPGLIGWILPWWLHRKITALQTRKLTPLIEAKYDEIDEICEKGHSLLF